MPRDLTQNDTFRALDNLAKTPTMRQPIEGAGPLRQVGVQDQTLQE